MNIKTERRKQLMTQTDLALKSGVALGTIQRIENGKIECTNLGIVLKVLDALGIPPSIFFSKYD